MNSASDHENIVVILTALGLEYDAVRAHLVDVQTRVHPAGTRFEIGILPGTSWPIALAMTGDGNTTAAVLVERAVGLFAPKALLFVGVAGSLTDDIHLGDVVVPTRVYALHGGRQDNDEFQVRPRAWEAPHDLEQLARHVERSKSWIRLLPDGAKEPPPKVFFRPIAAGEVVLDSRTSLLAQQIRRHYNDAAAIEMESAGVAQAGHLNRALPVLTVRGVSDAASGDKHVTDRAGWQPSAAAHAAAFALALVGALESAAEAPQPSEAPRALVGRRFARRWVVAGAVAVLAAAFGLVVLLGQVGRGQPEGGPSPGVITPSRPPFIPRRTANPSPMPSVQQERTVQLTSGDSRETVHIDHWRRAEGESGDLKIDQRRLYTEPGAGIALLPGTEPASYARCVTLPASAWTTEIALADLAADSQLCGYSTEDRYATLQVISVPSAQADRLLFYGRTWHTS